ncbi:hypothetical protein HAX54_047955 [Datura stramonium]|uniref:Uncharacterized protein n=1 Tax=Datura stramonium TaxID=4076 RepID=A0ABS8WIT5_DATST|nr:hypothetical protein [Datura stramonium]
MDEMNDFLDASAEKWAFALKFQMLHRDPNQSLALKALKEARVLHLQLRDSQARVKSSLLKVCNANNSEEFQSSSCPIYG